MCVQTGVTAPDKRVKLNWQSQVCKSSHINHCEEADINQHIWTKLQLHTVPDSSPRGKLLSSAIGRIRSVRSTMACNEGRMATLYPVLFQDDRLALSRGFIASKR